MLRAATANPRGIFVNVRRCQWQLLLIALALSACAPESLTEISRTHQTMGSEVRITVRAMDGATTQAALSAAFSEFDRLDALLSIWKPDSDVVKVNAAAGRAPVRVSRDTINVVRAAQEVSNWTGGKFDITFGALAGIWKFDHDRDMRVPTAVEIAARLPLVDYNAIVIDENAGTVFVSRPGMRIHLGGIGKGYAVDRAVAILRGAGLVDFMVQFGGDLYVSGVAADGPWRLGINDPRGAPNDAFAVVELQDSTFSTSGDYERAFIKDGTRYHHILDPDTGQPARGCVSVTIAAKNAMYADALSTGVFVLGPREGMALVERLPDVEAVIVSAANEVLISSGLRAHVDVRHAPTAVRP